VKSAACPEFLVLPGPKRVESKENLETNTELRRSYNPPKSFLERWGGEAERRAA
jgi:hypothetical protein